MVIKILGEKGKLSRALKKIDFLYNLNDFEDRNNSQTIIKVATFSPTLRNDNKENFKKEINYYKSLIQEINNNEYIIFISSQTLELTNCTYYSRAKKEIEKLLKNNLKNFIIIRPGMIFDSENKCYLLNKMNNASKSFLSFHKDIPKTTICSTKDIYDLIKYLNNNTNLMRGKTINIGLKKYTNLCNWYQLLAERPAIIKGYKFMDGNSEIPIP